MATLLVAGRRTIDTATAEIASLLPRSCTVEVRPCLEVASVD